MMPAEHRAARALFARAWGLERAALGAPEATPAMLTMVGAVSGLETHYGSPAAWTNAGMPQLAMSNNMGAIHCRNCDEPGCVPGADTFQDGEPYQICFKTYPSREDGARDLIRHMWKRPHVRAALTNGASIQDLVSGMYEDSYFTGSCPEALKEFGAQAIQESTVGQRQQGNTGGAVSEAGEECDAEAIKRYADRVAALANEISAAHGEEPIPRGLLPADALAGAGSVGDVLKGLGVVLGIIVLAGGGYYLYHRYQKSKRRNPNERDFRRNVSRGRLKAVYEGICREDVRAARERARHLIEEAKAACRTAKDEVADERAQEREIRAERRRARPATRRRRGRSYAAQVNDEAQNVAHHVSADERRVAVETFRGSAAEWFARAKGTRTSPSEFFIEWWEGAGAAEAARELAEAEDERVDRFVEELEREEREYYESGQPDDDDDEAA